MKTDMRTSLSAALLALLLAAGCGGDSTGGSTGGDDAAPGGDSGLVPPNDGGADPDGGGPDPDGGADPDMAVDPDGGGDFDAGDASPDAGGDAGIEDTLCAPCDADDDCEPGAKCLEAADGAKFCGRDCAGAECPAGYSCTDEGEGVEQCRPSTGLCGECADADGDGYGDGVGCLGADCNDGENRAWTGATDACDGVDNDCDGTTDEDFQPAECGVGACASQSRCEGGAELPCVPGAAAADDTTCDGRDDDCNGEADEDYVPQQCGQGVCVATSACAGGNETACTPGPVLSDRDETCDLVDDDCDGVADDDFVGEICGVGACAVPGVCEDGMTSCEPRDPIAENDATCDGVDDDCDGRSDEDFATEETCGLGVCRRAATCGEGSVSCTAGEPNSADDASCNGVDDDCDGRVDDDCDENYLEFREVSRDASSIVVDVLYTRNAPPDGDAEQSEPQIVRLWIRHPEGLRVPCADPEGQPSCDVDPARVERGASLIEAEKDFAAVQARSPTELYILALAINTNRIHAGQIARIRFDRVPGAQGPFQLGWDRARTQFAPVEADAVLQVREAALPD